MTVSEMFVFALIAVIAFVVAMYAILKAFCLEDDIVMLKDDLQDARKDTDKYRNLYACEKAKNNQLSTFNTALRYGESQK